MAAPLDVHARAEAPDGRDVLDVPATSLRVRQLVRAGVLPVALLDDALDAVRGPRDTVAVARAVMLLGGVVLLAASAASVVAASWSGVTGPVRIAVVLTGIVGAVATAVRVGPESAAGQAAVTIAGVLLAPLVWLVDASYPTGADAWLLFASWLALLAPMIVATRAPALMIVAVLAAHVAVPLFVHEELRSVRGAFAQAAVAAVVLLVVDGLAVALARRSAKRATARIIAVLGAAVAFAAGALAILIDGSGGWRMAVVVSTCSYAASLLSPLAAATATASARRTDGFHRSIASALVVALLLVGIGRVVLDEVTAARLALQAVLVAASVGALTTHLVRAHRRHHADEEEP